MAKLKTIAKLAKLNHKLGLIDAADAISLASTAYKVKNFSPTDHLPEWEFFEDEELKKAQRRKTLLIAGAVAAGTYLLLKNRDKVADAADDAKSKTRALAAESKDKGEEIIDDVADKSKKAYKDIKEKGEELKDKGENLKDDAKKKGDEAKDKAIDKGADIADDVADKAKDAKKDIKKLK